MRPGQAINFLEGAVPKAAVVRCVLCDERDGGDGSDGRPPREVLVAETALGYYLVRFRVLLSGAHGPTRATWRTAASAEDAARLFDVADPLHVRCLRMLGWWRLVAEET